MIKEQAHNLSERVKDLSFLYEISKLIRTRETIEELLQDITNIIPPAWQYPKITRAKIIFNGKQFISQDFKESKWKQFDDIVVKGKTVGSVAVYYIEERPTLSEGPFLVEEHKLLEEIAKIIGETIEKKHAEEALKKVKKNSRYFLIMHQQCLVILRGRVSILILITK